MRNFLAAAALAASVLVAFWPSPAWPETSGWKGVDEAVVNRYAAEHGRPADGGFLKLEGDALLFAFLVAGAAGGFAAGYFFRDFIGSKR